MTRKRAEELLPVIQAFAEGKEIEFKHKEGDEWFTQDYYVWDEDYEYRIKPEPREWYINIYDSDDSYMHNTKIQADNMGKGRIECIKVREILED